MISTEFRGNSSLRGALSLSRTQTHRRVVDRLNLRIDLRVRLTHASRQIHLQINNVAPHRRHSDGARAASKRERDPADQGGADSHRCLAWGLHGAHSGRGGIVAPHLEIFKGAEKTIVTSNIVADLTGVVIVNESTGVVIVANNA